MTPERVRRGVGPVVPVRGRAPRLAVSVLLLGGLLLLAGALAAPWLAAGSEIAGAVVHLLYRPLCHQLPERCPDLGHGPVALCARCIGLYAGGLAGLAIALLGRAWRPTFTALLLVAAPSIVDFGLGLVGLPSLPNLPRLLLALPLGAAVGSALAVATVDAFGASGNRSPRDTVE